MEKNISKNSQYVRFDWAIKRILRDEANKKVLEGLISVLIKEPVTITKIIESERNKNREEDKGNRVDVKAQTSSGEYILVEVQLTKESDFFQRILFGTSATVIDQIDIGQAYEVIRKIYSINILYFDFGEGEDYAYHGYMTFHGMTKHDSVLRFNTASEQKYIGRSLKRVTPPENVFPEYFLLRVNQFNEVAKTPIEEWMAYLKDGIINDNTTVPGLQEARKKLDFMKMTEQERRAYRRFMVDIHSSRDAFETARSDGHAEGLAEGLAEGMQKGLAEGMQKGLAEGMEKGLAEGTKNVARRMKAKGVPIEDIAELTGLTAEQIALLQ